MCCLQFEKEAYADAHKRLPKVGKKIRTPRGMGIVSDVNLIEEKVTVKFNDGDVQEVEVFYWEGISELNHDFSSNADTNSVDEHVDVSDNELDSEE